MQRAGNERLIAERLIRFALQSTVAVGIASKVPSDEEDSFRSASGALIRLSGHPILVTNWHVVETFRVFSAFRATQFFFADMAIDPVPRLYSESPELDLALVAAHKMRIRTDRGAAVGVPDIRLYEPNDWPPSRPERGETVFFAGWPEVGRSVDIPNMEVTFQPRAYVGVPVGDVTDRAFTIELDHSRLLGVTGQETQEQIHETRLSGLSGAPVFRLPSMPEASPELVGFIKEFSEGLNTFLATPAMNIRSDLRIQANA